MTGDWTSDSFRAALVAMVRRRVPERDTEDVVQAVLCEALGSPLRPTEPEGARKWIWAVARNKIADYHRRARRETFDVPERPVPVSQDALADLLRWAVGELPEGADAPRTFEWLLREAEGETLEEIALREQLSPAQVRQRVSRLRRHFRARWTVYAAALGLLAVLLYLTVRHRRPAEHGPLVTPAPEQLAARDHGRALRVVALRACSDHRWGVCLDGLDAARALDPVGDDAPGVQAARRQALDALAPTPRPPPPPSPPVTFGPDGGMSSFVDRPRAHSTSSMDSLGAPSLDGGVRRRRPGTLPPPPPPYVPTNGGS